MAKRYHIVIQPEAEADISEIYEYIAVQLENPRAAYELCDLIYQELETLDEMPERFHVWPVSPWKARKVRSMIIRNYHALYSVDKKGNVVNVLRVFYGRQDV